MNTSIKTNQLEYTLNRDNFSEKYDIFCLETSDKYIKRGAYILDAAELCNDVKAIKFEAGKKLYLLMYKNSSNKEKLKQLLMKLEEGNKFSISNVRAYDLKDDYLIQLLLNSMGTYDSESMKFNNLTGHLYCFHSDWIKRGKEGNADVIWKVPCLEISVSSSMNLELNVRTFTSELLRNRITFSKRKFEDYPKYVFSANNTLRRRLKGDTKTCFIQRQIDGVKTEITFLDLQSKKKFEHTKMGVLQSVITGFNEKFAKICQLEFQSKEVKCRRDYSKSVQKENTKRIREILEETGVHLLDRIADDYSAIFIKNIKQLLEKKYEIIATAGKRVKKDKLNIMLIHNAEYYNGVNDPHDEIYDGAAVQHITFEDFSDSSEFALATVVHEIIIKKDIEEGRITLFDWEKLGFDREISFGMEAEIDEVKRYFFIKVNPDGTFEIWEQEFSLFEMNEYFEMTEIFEQGRTRSETVKGVIRFADGGINVLKDTGLFTIPETAKIAELLAAGDNKLRGRERREELMSSLLDIKLYEENGAYYYFVGTIGEGMRQKIPRAAVIRKVEGYNESDLCFDRLLPLMNVSFVHNGQLTVIPFPFKYLREYTNR